MQTAPDTLTIYQVDAFTNKLFSGNPAAVCPLEYWLSDQLLQQIAEENNLSETAFFIPHENGYKLRWFTPTTEVDLCGHATLAAAHVLFHHLQISGEEVTFHSLSGPLMVRKENGGYEMNFPADQVVQKESPESLVLSLGTQPEEIWRGKDDYLVLVKDEQTLRYINPDLRLMKRVEARGIIVTARGAACDFVSRFFAPQSGVDEDPVTGSAHTTLTPFWSRRLHKKQLTALQLSQRGGTLFCRLEGDRVILRGQALTYMQGTLYLQSLQP